LMEKLAAGGASASRTAAALVAVPVVGVDDGHGHVEVGRAHNALVPGGGLGEDVGVEAGRPKESARYPRGLHGLLAGLVAGVTTFRSPDGRGMTAVKEDSRTRWDRPSFAATATNCLPLSLAMLRKARSTPCNARRRSRARWLSAWGRVLMACSPLIRLAKASTNRGSSSRFPSAEHLAQVPGQLLTVRERRLPPARGNHVGRVGLVEVAAGGAGPDRSRVRRCHTARDAESGRCPLAGRAGHQAVEHRHGRRGFDDGGVSRSAQPGTP